MRVSYQVATVLTVYGIETHKRLEIPFSPVVATVLTVYGIETFEELADMKGFAVATVLTVYGIETDKNFQFYLSIVGCNSTYRLRY